MMASNENKHRALHGHVVLGKKEIKAGLKVAVKRAQIFGDTRAEALAIARMKSFS